MIVLDTCAFLTQKHPNGEFATVPGIKNEIVNKQSKQYFENMLATNLKIMKAEKSSYEIVQKHAKETGDFDVLSRVDIDIIALGYQCKGTIITDDFAIQNIALALNIMNVEVVGGAKKENGQQKFQCQRKIDRPKVCKN